MSTCPECGVTTSPGDEECFSCGTSLTGGTGSNRSLLATLTLAGRQAMPFVHNAGASVQHDPRRVEDGKIEYALFLPFSRGFMAIILGMLAMFGCAFALFPLARLLDAVGVLPTASVAYGTVPLLWDPIAVWRFLSDSFAISQGAGIGGTLRVVALLGGLLPSLGYSYRLTSAATRGEATQPFFTDFPRLVGQGVVFYGFFAGLAAVATLGGELAATAAVSAGAPPFMVGLLVTLVVWYFIPAVLVLYAATGRLRDVSPRLVAALALSKRYAVAYPVFLVLWVAIFVSVTVVSLLLALTVVGIVLAVPLVFTLAVYPQYFAAAFWGGTYYQAAAAGEVPTPPSPESDQ